MYPAIPRVLSIAGTDPTGGAGAQADIKSISAAGGYALSVITALLSQNTCGVRSIFTPPLTFLADQLAAVVDDVTVDAIKIGMLGDSDTIAAVSAFLDEQAAQIPIVVLDPVMVASSGDRLLSEGAEDALRDLLRHATAITPNIPELALLCRAPEPTSFAEAEKMAQSLAEDNDCIVIVKGGHLTGADAGNTVIQPGAMPVHVPAPRVDTQCTHGTGCSLSSALATRLAINPDPVAAMRWVTTWLTESITHAEALQVGSGNGHGPIDHFHRIRRLAVAGTAAPFVEFETPLGDATTPESLLTRRPASTVKEPHIPAPGPWTRALWEAGTDLWWRIMDLDFIRRLKDGTLPAEAFSTYIGQDAHYLAEYARALGHLGVKAPTVQDRLVWLTDAEQCIVAEMELHRSIIGADTPAEPPSPITSAYTDFLCATVAGDDYAVGAAAVLPCYWLYLEIGLEMGPAPSDHPFKAWIDEYSSQEFYDCTTAAIARVEQAMEQASPQTRRRAARAYLLAARHEREFFAQALRR